MSQFFGVFLTMLKPPGSNITTKVNIDYLRNSSGSKKKGPLINEKVAGGRQVQNQAAVMRVSVGGVGC